MNRFLPKYDADLKKELHEALANAPSRTLMFDGWESKRKDVLINYVLSSNVGDQFLGDIDLTGKNKNADDYVPITMGFLKVCRIVYYYVVLNTNIRVRY